MSKNQPKSSKHVFSIFTNGTPPARKALARLTQRLDALENLDSAVYRTRVKKLFGRVLRPAGVVDEILKEVRRDGDQALQKYTGRIDGFKLTSKNMKVTRAERTAALKRIPSSLREALRLAAHRIALYQKRLLPADVPLLPVVGGPSGVRSGLSWSPLRRVGVYVPGGTAAYPSSVLMNVVPAQVAGVKEIALATPCGPDGKLADGVLAACEMLGIEEIYRMGGAQAIGALAYGTEKIPPVEKIIGPGNVFVMLAKRAVFGQVDIDMLAGPSEVLVLAEAKARADWIAADLLAQAEHDPLASCVLVTPSRNLAAKVQAEVIRQLDRLPRREIAEASLRDWGMALVTRNMSEAVQVANDLAPEHLEIFAARPRTWARKLTTAGAIFLGGFATEALGDYMAGPSHTLPTGGTARAFSGVSVFTFLRRTSLIEADKPGLADLSQAIQVLAEAEGLEAHRRAVAIRDKKQ